MPCCPQLVADGSCDALDFHYRLIHTATINLDNQVRRVPVEVILHARLERCPGPLALGDLVYSTTLLPPGEKVRLFSTDRRTRFSLDSATSVSYRREQTSEERYFMSSMSDFMSDLTVRDKGRSGNQRRGSFETHGETNGALDAFFSGPSIDVNGSYNARKSTSDFLRELKQHASASSERSVEATRAASSVSVGEVQARSHAEGESEDHFEVRLADLRQPEPLPRGHLLFLSDQQDPDRPPDAGVDPAARDRSGRRHPHRQQSVRLPWRGVGDPERGPGDRQGAPGRRTDRPHECRRRPGRHHGQSGAAHEPFLSTASFAVAEPAEPLPSAVRAKALAAVEADLAKAGLIDRKTGEVTEEAKASFAYEIARQLPTPGMLVRGCLDDCDICEPALMREIELDLERRALPNELLKRRIEILHNAQGIAAARPSSATETA